MGVGCWRLYEWMRESIHTSQVAHSKASGDRVRGSRGKSGCWKLRRWIWKNPPKLQGLPAARLAGNRSYTEGLGGEHLYLMDCTLPGQA
eukprot:1157589-Pelagomonas_calceolata.AAC.4